MHRLFLVLALLLAPLVQASAVSIETAYTRYYEDGEIRPIGQYFGASLIGQGFRSVVASQPDRPAGQYFIAKLEELSAPMPVQARMTLYLSNSKEPTTHTWDLAGASLKKWLYLGLTGTDWPAHEVQPLAWRIELLDAQGTLLAEWKSFLWEMP
ncbi:MAG TPA: hypothetical protein VK995_06485 [Oceanipulchritudo sp.]|nr:hypothetical protein [Oceanipulchritudo sp.]